MTMDQKAVDETVALLMIPLAYKLLDRVKNKEYGDRELQEIIDFYFRFKRMFEDTCGDVRRGVISY